MRKLIASLVLVVLWATPVLAGDLVVSAAASLTDVFAALKPVFEKSRPGTTLVFNFAASGPLLAQIAQGAPVDAFASADQKTMDDAVSKGLMDTATRVTFARNDLVIATPTGAAPVTSLAAMSGPTVARIGIGNPETVPAGRYAKAALVKAGLWDALSRKYIMAETVRQVLDYLTRGEIDAGFVYATDARKGGDKVAVTGAVPLETPVTYPAAVTAGAKDKAGARAFVDFLKSADALKVLQAFGFSAP